MNIEQGKLLRGRDIEINGVGILKPIIVDEIIDIGEYLNNLCFDIDDLQVSGEEQKKLIDDKITTFQVIVSACFHDIKHLQLIIKALKFFLKEDICFFREYGIFFLGNFDEQRFITSDNYEEIKNIIKLQNGISSNDVLDENPADERTRMLLEKRRKIRKKLAKAKAKNDDGESEPLTFADLISIMCANANGITHENVWNMNIYMFQNQFQRMKLIEDYDISIRSILAGANPDKIDMKHFMSHL
jgi:DNA-binding transcriptional MerR regulator